MSAAPYHNFCTNPGYQYRSFSTNTGDNTFHDIKEQNVFERKLEQIQNDISSKINTELEKTSNAREAMLTKFEKLCSQIESIVELQNKLIDMKINLACSEKSLRTLTDKVDKIEMFLDNNYMKDGDNVIFTKPDRIQPFKDSQLEIEEACITLTENDLL